MPATLATLQATVQTTWEALTPENDGTSIPYAFVDDFVEERANGGHRHLIWRMARAASPGLEPATHVRWTFDCELFLQRRDRTYAAFRRAVEAEAVNLLRAFHALPDQDLGANVLSGTITDIFIETEEPTRNDQGLGGGLPQDVVAIVRFNFSAETQEG